MSDEKIMETDVSTGNQNKKRRQGGRFGFRREKGMAGMKRSGKHGNGIWAVALSAALLCGLYGCGGAETTAAEKTTAEAVKAPAAVPVQDGEPEKQWSGDLDAPLPDTGNDDWYKEESVYTDDTGRRLEVFWDDEGMLGFAVDGLSLYFTSADNCQKENNWRIYTCDDGTNIVYYPGDPAHLEICDGEYAGMYEAGGDKVK